MTIKEMSIKSNVSIRTLHYYDEIGILKPIKVLDNGYRIYDDSSINILCQILIFKELEFSLKEIKEILSSNVDKEVIIKEQINILKTKKSHLDDVINMAENLACGKEIKMENKELLKKLDEYSNETQEKYSKTEEYIEYSEKTKNLSEDNKSNLNIELMEKLKEFSKLKDVDPTLEIVKLKVKSLQEYMSANFYKCSDEMLLSLANLYVSDERFKSNIDNYSEEGTASYISLAIKTYLENK